MMRGIRKKLMEAYRLVNEMDGCLGALGKLRLDMNDSDIDLATALNRAENALCKDCHAAIASRAIRNMRREILVGMGAMRVLDEKE